MKLIKSQLYCLLALLLLHLPWANAQSNLLLKPSNSSCQLTTSTEDISIDDNQSKSAFADYVAEVISAGDYFEIDKIIRENPSVSSVCIILNQAIGINQTETLEYLIKRNLHQKIESNAMFGVITSAIQSDDVESYKLLVQYAPSKHKEDFLFMAARSNKFNIFYHIYINEGLKDSVPIELLLVEASDFDSESILTFLQKTK